MNKGLENMCQILKMACNGGQIIVEVSASRELTNCFFELYNFNFKTGEYESKPTLRQVISDMHISRDSGIYRFQSGVSSNCKLKCVISDGEKTLASRERFIGERHKVKVSKEQSPIGILYNLKSDINISRKLIFYKSPKSSTKINIPDDLRVGEMLTFVIRSNDIPPRFETYPEFNECLIIES